MDKNKCFTSGNKFLLIIFSMITSIFFAQNMYQVQYILTFKPQQNSTLEKSCLMTLYVHGLNSTFFDNEMLKADSILTSSKNKFEQSGEILDYDTDIDVNFTFVINKNLENKNIIYMDHILNGLNPLMIAYQEPVELEWKLTNEISTVQNYICQKAILQYGGRNWIAWFTTQIPIQDGPYKFHGLPGLIVKIHDNEFNYNWELEKIQSNKRNSFITPIFSNQKIKFMSKQEFENVFATYTKNPMQAFNELSEEVLDSYVPGINVKLREYIKTQGDIIKNKYSSSTNLIEL